jgi:hypothetical protein
MPLPAPLSAPVPTAVPLAKPTFTPLPVPVATPAPVPAPLPVPAPTPIPAPLIAPPVPATALPRPTFTPLAVPVARPLPAAAPTPLSAPTPTPTPVPAPAPTPRTTFVDSPPQPSGNTAAPQSQSVRPVTNPAEQGGANGTADPSTRNSGKLNLDGSTHDGGGSGSVQPPGSGASAPLNLDLHGGGSGPSLGRTRSGLVPMLPAPAEKKTQLETDLEKAQRAKCAEAYAGNGLLAVIPLAKDAVTGKGCKW